MPIPAHPDRRLLVCVDLERYSRQDNLRQYQSQRILRDVLDEAVAEIGLDRDAWTTQQGGDGELAILPAQTPEPPVIGALAPALDRALRERNRSLVPEAKVRLRLAVHQGLVHLDGATGFPGEAVVDVCRLCDSQPARRALAAFPAAATVLIVSETVYRDVVAHGYAGIRPERFRAVRISTAGKGFRATAWIFVPDENVTRCPAELDDPAEPDDSGPDQPDAEPDCPRTPTPPAGSTRSERHNADTFVFGAPVTTHGPTGFFTGDHASGTVIGTINHVGDTP
jgi:hypothetical protein